MTDPSEPIVVVGIFEEDEALDAAGEQLASEGIENAVYDEAIVAEPFGTDSMGPIPSHPDRIPTVISRRLSDSLALVQEFKCRLSDHCLPADAIEAYAIAFSRKGKLVLVETDAGRADRVADILRDSRAARVNRHD